MPRALRASCPSTLVPNVPRAICALVPHVSHALRTPVLHLPRALLALCLPCFALHVLRTL